MSSVITRHCVGSILMHDSCILSAVVNSFGIKIATVFVDGAFSVMLQMRHFDVISEKLVCSTDEHTRMYGCMVAMALLRHHPEACISLLLEWV